MASSKLIPIFIFWWMMSRTSAQYYCCMSVGKCEYENPLAPGVTCYGTEEMCTQACGGAAAEGAPQPIQDVDGGSVGAVAKAANIAGDVINACNNAATGIRHAVLHLFGFMELSTSAAVTGERGRVPEPLPDLSV
mmetsp:Transcript_94666/g.168173  ORF Transcript_94666/g.168173 Transcript_94666/m.168173 type:complete len:135 (-) Transcript_94666:86-490(-)|eukprot:CAMPEP_0197652772 /NCGR_PEP_ID=MMETSP1338-20131121/34652_1 /TAXON_ID=43686 ORGANISM="Pelagodinium beii, Strain RCC1491" /NCGR_SAMPLE_ID=MMETSP1338 /ASSEMBLY_ACC=CAM_ASM_000754 /LENGTH=134 /DNA_ID=CAMNT_0043227715 /DNA_START=63 /DNA_END=467 /DNA_ORIENTATION=-